MYGGYTVDPDTIMSRIEEIVRMVAALTHEVCACDDLGRPNPLPNASHVMDHLMLAHVQLARCLATQEDLDREAQSGLDTLKSGHPDLYRVVAGFLANIGSRPGDACWNVNTHLPMRLMLPPEPATGEAQRKLDQAMRAVVRLPRSAAWCSVGDEDEDEQAEADGAGAIQ